MAADPLSGLFKIVAEIAAVAALLPPKQTHYDRRGLDSNSTFGVSA
jgi:hypothetical protein